MHDLALLQHIGAVSRSLGRVRFCSLNKIPAPGLEPADGSRHLLDDQRHALRRLVEQHQQRAGPSACAPRSGICCSPPLICRRAMRHLAGWGIAQNRILGRPVRRGFAAGQWRGGWQPTSGFYGTVRSVKMHACPRAHSPGPGARSVRGRGRGWPGPAARGLPVRASETARLFSVVLLPAPFAAHQRHHSPRPR